VTGPGHPLWINEDTLKTTAAYFLTDFMFQQIDSEWLSMRSQIVTSKGSRGVHRRFLPCAYIEQLARRDQQALLRTIEVLLSKAS
jgi:hypothetical protein